MNLFGALKDPKESTPEKRVQMYGWCKFKTIPLPFSTQPWVFKGNKIEGKRILTHEL